MAHKTLVGGTSYNVTSGTSMVRGTMYSIAKGKTLVRGSEYDINFGPVKVKTAMLYSDGNFVFQGGDDVAPGKTLVASYTDFKDTTTPPWNGKQGSFKDVSFDIEVAPVSMSNWFYNARNMTTNIDNFSNLNMDNLINMAYAYYSCRNLTGTPVCGKNVTDMHYAYAYCYNLTGAPVCGNNVTNMAYAYYNCKNLWGDAYVLSPNVTNVASCFYGRNVRKRLNIYVQAGSTTNTVVHYNNMSSLTGGFSIIWTNAGSYQYNTASNIYIYPVANVISTGIQKGDLKQ